MFTDASYVPGSVSNALCIISSAKSPRRELLLSCFVDRTREVKSLAESHTADNKPSLYPTDSKLLSLTTAQSCIFTVSWLLEWVKGQQRFMVGEGGRCLCLLKQLYRSGWLPTPSPPPRPHPHLPEAWAGFSQPACPTRGFASCRERRRNRLLFK